MIAYMIIDREGTVRWPPAGSMWFFSGTFRPRVFPDTPYKSAYLVGDNEIITVIRGSERNRGNGVLVVASNSLAVGTMSLSWFENEKPEEKTRVA